MTVSTPSELSRVPGVAAGGVLRQTFARFPSGVVAVCAAVGGELVGMAASSYTSVSMSPALVSVCIQKTSSTWSRLRPARSLGISVLADHQGRACRQLSLKEGDRFAGLETTTTLLGSVLIADAAAWLECTVYAELDAGDHIIVLLEVQGVDARLGVEPLVFHDGQFRSLSAKA